MASATTASPGPIGADGVGVPVPGDVVASVETGVAFSVGVFGDPVVAVVGTAVSPVAVSFVAVGSTVGVAAGVGVPVVVTTPP